MNKKKETASPHKGLNSQFICNSKLICFGIAGKQNLLLMEFAKIHCLSLLYTITIWQLKERKNNGLSAGPVGIVTSSKAGAVVRHIRKDTTTFTKRRGNFNDSPSILTSRKYPIIIPWVSMSHRTPFIHWCVYYKACNK